MGGIWKIEIYFLNENSVKLDKDSYIQRITTYDAETWVLIKNIIDKLKINKKVIDRKILGITLNDRRRNV